MKICKNCKKKKPINEFNKNKYKKDGLQIHCKICTRLTSKYHYLNNKKSYLKRNLKFKLKIKETVRKLKSQPCTDCKNSFPYYVMDFDHVKGKKIGNISLLSNQGYYKKTLDEIKKCEVVCSNCHRIRTYKRIRNCHGGLVGKAPG